MVVHGAGVDELPLDGSGRVHDVTGDGILSFTVDVDGLGLERAPTSALVGGTADENAAILESIFAGETGPRRDVVLLNAGAALVAPAGRERARRGYRGGPERHRRRHCPRDLLARLRAERRAAATTAAEGAEGAGSAPAGVPA